MRVIEDACQFTGHQAGDRCPACGYVLAYTLASIPYRRCPGAGTRAAVRCEHGGEYTGERAATPGRATCGCPGDTMVFACELYGRCSPFARSTDPAVKFCGDCNDRQQTE